MSEFSSKERRVGIVGVLALRIDRYQAVVAVPIKKRDLLRAVQDFERQAAGVMTRNSTDDAQTFGIDRRGEIVLKRRFAGRRQRQFESRKILADVSNGFRIAGAFPISAEVGMAIRHP